MATALFVAVIASCGTGAPRTDVVSVSDLVAAPAKFDGRVVTVNAAVRDAGAHGMFVTDPADPKKGLDLYIQPEIAWSEPVMAMTRMLLADRDRDQPLGVVATLTGKFSWKREGLSLLSVSKVENPRSGAMPAH